MFDRADQCFCALDFCNGLYSVVKVSKKRLKIKIIGAVLWLKTIVALAEKSY